MSPRSNRRAFTLVELLVAIAIIVILVSLTLTVGASVSNSGRKRATEGAIRALDQALDAYLQAKGGSVPGFIQVEPDRLPSDAQSGSQARFYPLIDGYSDDDEQPINTIGLFLYDARTVSAVTDIISGLNTKFVRQYQPGVGDSAVLQPELTTVFDAWGNPIRMVHPRFDGRLVQTAPPPGDAGNPVDISDPNEGIVLGVEAQPAFRAQIVLKEVRRNAPTDTDRQTNPALVGDSDGGLCPAPRPYFYSAGPDGDPATTDDNVYSVTPRFETP